MVKLDILSDPICPWCYIGKDALDRALAKHPNHPFVIEWHPFQLNPDMPPEGMDRVTYLEQKFGGKQGAVRAYAPIVERAEEAGLTINFNRIERTPNTLDAHRLIHWAGLEGRQAATVSALFNAYFVDGKDISDTKILCDIAEGVGLDRAMIEHLLSGDADRDEIRARDALARERGVTGVPTFILANGQVVPGAQPVELWDKVITELLSQQVNGT